ncbi:peroxidase [Salvia divinorum]|uniref:Peroxidase n=1 Tax=Salvia divinorum TaxID=28513 RepID=A0ABD1HG01_SALDI
MADPPSLRLADSLKLKNGEENQSDDEFGIHSLSEVEEMKKKFLERVRTHEIDTDSEYEKEMEEDRIADRKNGHFVDDLVPKVSRTRQKNGSKSSAARQVHAADRTLRSSARVSARVAAYEAHSSPTVSAGWNLDNKDEEEGKTVSIAVAAHNANIFLEGDQRADSFSLEVTEIGGIFVAENGERSLTHPIKTVADSAVIGGSDTYGKTNINGSLSVISEQPKVEVDTLMIATNQVPPHLIAKVNPSFLDENLDYSFLENGGKSGALMESDLERVNLHGKITKILNTSPNALHQPIAKDNTWCMHGESVHSIAKDYTWCMHGESVHSILENGDNLGTAIMEDSMGLQTDESQTNFNAMPRVHESPTLKTHAIEAYPISAFHDEVSASMDLIESQPLLHRQFQHHPTFGPLPHGLLAKIVGNKLQSTLPAHHTAQVIPSAFLPYMPVTHCTKISSKPKLPSLSNTSRLNNSPIQPTISNGQTPTHPITKTKHAQKKTDTHSPPLITTEIAFASFGNPMHEASNPTLAPSFSATNHYPTPMESSDFPLLGLMNGPAISALSASEAKGNNASRPEVATPSSSWADIVEKEQGVKNVNCDGHLVGDGMNLEKQPKVFFKRSMADVLRSGQSTEGPILLDHARAQKRGEVRMIEGKPCLFFSTDESTDLAGRIGPAIIGKFSHSIPTAHQIQKALGNLKLVGTMSWNFLNAKHVFIQLSEMCDYAKILNGPNNTPVWYIEHHPMRVFKWTPDFDPFFEIPIVALWCNILALPVHLFEESALIAIGNLLGHAVQVDRATISRSRVSFARICVEVDISQSIPEEISLDIAGKRVTLKVKWDKIPLYCGECRHVGHNADNCYAFGRRPMPPKRDYSRGAPSKSGPSVQRHGDQPQPRQKKNDQNRESVQVRRHEGQPRGGHATGDHRIVFPHAQSPGGQPHGRQTLETQQRENHEVRGPAVHILQKDSTLLEIALKAKGHLSDAGPSGTAMEETQEAEHNGFFLPKKKKKTRSAANRARKNERRRQRKEHNSTSAEVESEGGGVHRSDGHDSALESDRGNGSLFPSYRPRHVDGPLAMVAVNNNMFGALEDFPSDDDEGKLAPDILDTRMIEASDSRTRLLELEAHGTGHTSPPSEGRLKKARLVASGAF